MPEPTVDASVWVSAFDSTDRFHAESAVFLRHLALRSVIAHAPAILILEIGCALARRCADPATGLEAATRLEENRMLKLEALGRSLLAEALRLGTHGRLRAADALYAATAALRTAGVLVSWDKDLIDRAGAVTPAEWLAAHR
jgi:predicted nucleic acid-binding protein